MTTYVALLRGINVGGNNKINMKELKECFESLGYSNVTTHINSGNVIFKTKQKSPRKLTTEIEKHIQKTFNLQIPVLVRDNINIHTICTAIPTEWENNAEQKTDVMFLWETFANEDILNQIEKNATVDTLLYEAETIIWHLKKKNYTKSKIGKLIGTDIYKNMTVRNVNTIRKIESIMKEINES